MKQASSRRTIKFTVLALGFIISAGISGVQAAKLYKWVDENGVVHYSDKIPPEANKKAHEELDSRGVRKRELGREKTDEERMSEKMEKTLAEQQRRIEAEKLARQRMRDQILLQTFTTERDLVLTRDDRLNAIDSILNLTLTNNKRIVQQIEETKTRIAQIENSGRQVPENLSQKLESLNQQHEKNKSFVELKQKERLEQSEKFDADIRRFRELKGIEPVAEPVEEKKVAEPKEEDAAAEKAAEPKEEDVAAEKVAETGIPE